MTGYFFRKRIYLVLLIIAAAMLLIARVRLPYDYYMVLRLAVCAVSIAIAVNANRAQHMFLTWSFGVVAVLYNPFLRVHLTRDIWQVLNLMTVAFFAYAVYIVETLRKKSNY